MTVTTTGGAGVKINDMYMLTFRLDKLLGDAPRMKSMQQNAASLGKPFAAETITSHILQALE